MPEFRTVCRATPQSCAGRAKREWAVPGNWEHAPPPVMAGEGGSTVLAACLNARAAGTADHRLDVAPHGACQAHVDLRRRGEAELWNDFDEPKRDEAMST